MTCGKRTRTRRNKCSGKIRGPKNPLSELALGNIAEMNRKMHKKFGPLITKAKDLFTNHREVQKEVLNVVVSLTLDVQTGLATDPGNDIPLALLTIVLFLRDERKRYEGLRQHLPTWLQGTSLEEVARRALKFLQLCKETQRFTQKIIKLRNAFKTFSPACGKSDYACSASYAFLHRISLRSKAYALFGSMMSRYPLLETSRFYASCKQSWCYAYDVTQDVVRAYVDAMPFPHISNIHKRKYLPSEVMWATQSMYMNASASQLRNLCDRLAFFQWETYVNLLVFDLSNKSTRREWALLSGISLEGIDVLGTVNSTMKTFISNTMRIRTAKERASKSSEESASTATTVVARA